jgi:hypothetical protein
MFPVLKMWTEKQPLTILQMLPEWMWRRTALDLGTAVGFKSSIMGVANQQLSLHKPLRRSRSIGFKVEDRSKIPVITLDWDKAAQWSQMLIGKADALVPGYLLPPELEIEEDISSSFLEKEDGTVSDLDAAEIVKRFRMTTSPLGRELAGLLAASPVINLPVVRLIQESLLPKSNQVQVAEVFLGGLLRPQSVSLEKLQNQESEIKTILNPDSVEYEFIQSEIRDIFLDDAPISDSIDVVNAVSRYVAEQLGVSLSEFMAVLKAPQQAQEEQREDIIKPFAQITARVLRKLGGQYVQFAEDLDQANNDDSNSSITDSREESFFTSKEIREIVENSQFITLGEKIVEVMLVFKPKKQRTWLVSTSKQVFFLLDDENTRASQKIIQYQQKLTDSFPINTQNKSGSSGIFQLGKSAFWYYSIDLLGEPQQAQLKLQKFIEIVKISIFRLTKNLFFDNKNTDALGLKIMTIENFILPSGWIRSTREISNAHYILKINENKEYVICDRQGIPYPYLQPALSIDNTDAPRRLVERLVHLAQYHTILALENQNSELSNDVEYELLDAHKQPFADPTNIRLLEGDQCYLRVKNVSSHSLNIAILDFEPTWEISQIPIEGDRADFYPLESGQETLTKLRLSLPDEVNYLYSYESMKLFLTRGMADFGALVLPSLDSGLQSVKRGRLLRRLQESSPLNELIQLLSSDRPSIQEINLADYGQDWSTKLINLTVTRSENVLDQPLTEEVKSDNGSNNIRTILVLVADPQGSNSLNLLPEVRNLQEAMQRSANRERFTIEWRVAVQYEDLQRYILDIKPQIIHFCGHGTKDGLVIHDENNQVKLLSNKVLADLLKNFADSVECLVLNACETEPLAIEVAKHINYVIGMNREVNDQLSIAFTEAFYGAIGAGQRIESAFEFGSSAILGITSSSNQSRSLYAPKEEDSPVNIQNQENLIPVLYKNKNPLSLSASGDVLKSVDSLITALRDKDSNLRKIAAQALGNIGNENAVEPLIAVLQDEDSDVRKIAAQVLGNIGNEKVVDSLIAVLQDKDSDVRKIAAQALGNIGNEKAVDSLIAALQDEDSDVRKIAAQVLGNIGNENVIDA